MSPEWKRRVSLAIVLLVLLIFLLTSFGCGVKELKREKFDHRDPTAGIFRWGR